MAPVPSPIVALKSLIRRHRTAAKAAQALGLPHHSLRTWLSRGRVPEAHVAAVVAAAAEPEAVEAEVEADVEAPLEADVEAPLEDHLEAGDRHPLLCAFPTGSGEPAEFENRTVYRAARWCRPGELARWIRENIGERFDNTSGLALLAIETWRAKRTLHELDRGVVYPHPETPGDCGLVLLARDDGSALVGTSPGPGCTWIATCEGTVELRRLMRTLDRGDPLLPAASDVADAFAGEVAS